MPASATHLRSHLVRLLGVTARNWGLAGCAASRPNVPAGPWLRSMHRHSHAKR
jgi:hypothetical protein